MAESNPLDLPKRSARQSDGFVFDAFLSYAWSDNFASVRATKVFLESFHTRVLCEAPVRALHVCVDGIDFKRPRSKAGGGHDEPSDSTPLRRLIAEHLRQSHWLVVYGSKQAAKESGWVEWEVEEFIRQRGGDSSRVLLVTTGGAKRSMSLAQEFPRSVTRRLLHEGIRFDFSGLLLSWPQRLTRDGRQRYCRGLESRAQLASALHGESAGELLPGWRLAQRRARRRTRLLTTATAVLLLGTFLFLQRQFRTYDLQARARALVAKVGHEVPASSEDWHALEELASSPGGVRDAALEWSLSEPNAARRALRRPAAFMRAVVGLDAKSRETACERLAEFLRSPELASGPSLELAIALVVEIEASDAALLDLTAEAWRSAAAADPSSTSLGALGARLAGLLPAADASDSFWALLSGPPSAEVPPAHREALASLASRLGAADRALAANSLFRKLQALETDGEAAMPSLGSLGAALRMCLPAGAERLEWVLRLRSELETLESTGQGLLASQLERTLVEALAELDSDHAAGAALELLPKLKSTTGVQARTARELSVTLERVVDPDAAERLLRGLAESWPARWNSEALTALELLRTGLPRLADHVSAAAVDPLSTDILCRMASVYATQGDWAYHITSGLRPALERLVARLTADRRARLLEAALGLEDPGGAAIEPWPEMEALPPESLKASLQPLLGTLVAEAPDSCDRTLCAALTVNPTDWGERGKLIGRGARAWPPQRVGALLEAILKEQVDADNADFRRALPALTERASGHAPAVLLERMLRWFDTTEVDLVARDLADALAVHAELSSSDAERIYERLRRIRAALPATFSGSLTASAYSDRIARMESRLSAERLARRIDEFEPGEWPSVGLASAVDSRTAEVLWTSLLSQRSQWTSSRIVEGSRTTYLGAGRVEALERLAEGIEAGTVGKQLHELLGLVQEIEREGLSLELEPVLLKLAERVPSGQASALCGDLLPVLRKRWSDEGRMVFGRVLTTLARKAGDASIASLLRSPAVAGSIEETLLGRH